MSLQPRYILITIILSETRQRHIAKRFWHSTSSAAVVFSWMIAHGAHSATRASLVCLRTMEEISKLLLKLLPVSTVKRLLTSHRILWSRRMFAAVITTLHGLPPGDMSRLLKHCLASITTMRSILNSIRIEYVDINRICLSPQCGFASTEEGNLLTEEQQWNKLVFIKEIADEIWK